MSSDAAYRRELELELERLARELADVRVEKAQQQQRIEQLQLEQSQLQDQLGQRTAGDKELRTDLAQQLHSLHQAVRDKKTEHGKVKREWERSQEKYNHLRQTVGALQGHAISSLINDDDDDGDDDLEGKELYSRDVLKSLTGNDAFDNSTSAARLDEASCGDNDTVVTEHTKDSLQLLRNKQQRNKRNKDGDDNGSGGGLSKFLSKESRQSTQPPPTSSSGSASKLGAFLENDSKKSFKPIEKDVKSANE